MSTGFRVVQRAALEGLEARRLRFPLIPAYWWVSARDLTQWGIEDIERHATEAEVRSMRRALNKLAVAGRVDLARSKWGDLVACASKGYEGPLNGRQQKLLDHRLARITLIAIAPRVGLALCSAPLDPTPAAQFSIVSGHRGGKPNDGQVASHGSGRGTAELHAESCLLAGPPGAGSG